MTRPRAATALILFLVALCIGVPVAFQAGLANAVMKGPVPKYLFGPAEYASGTRDFYDCYRNVRLPALRQFDRIQDCRPPGETSGTGIYARADRPRKPWTRSSSSRKGPLTRAFAATVAGGPAHPTKIAGAQPIATGAPFDIAMAPGMGTAAVFGPPLVPTGQSPGNLIPPGFIGTLAPPVNPGAPPAPVVETPLPAGLPLLVTGIIGLGAAVRRKRAA